MNSTADLIGPAVEALPLTPATLSIEGLAPALPPVPSPSFLTPVAAPRPSRLWLDGITTAALAPVLSFRSSAPSQRVMLVFVSIFLVWAGYFAPPGLAQSMPASTWQGAGYLALLVPGSIFASCLVLSAGRALGVACGFLAARLSPGKTIR